MSRFAAKGLLALCTLALISGCARGPDILPRIVDRGVLIEDVTLISPERASPLRFADVAIADGRITAVGTLLAAGKGVQRIDGRGRYLIPGLIDSHVHVGHASGIDEDALDADAELRDAYRVQLPRAYLAFGFTTLVDLDMRDRDRAIFADAPLRPRLVHCSRGLRIAGGYGTSRIPPGAATANYPQLVYEAEQAQSWPATIDPAEHSPARAVERAAASGAQCIKIFVEPGFGGTFDWPVPLPQTLRLIHAEAGRRGLPLLIHATGVEAWQSAADIGADVIAHGLWHWPGERISADPSAEARAVIAAAARKGIAVQPTLRVVHGERSIFDWSILEDPRLGYALPQAAVAYLHSDKAGRARAALLAEYEAAAPGQDIRALIGTGGARATATLRLMDAAGMRLLFGSDTGGGEGIANPPGLNGRLELQLWSEAGVPLPRILRAATLDNAAMIGMAGELGSIEVGKRADLLLLTADPYESVEAYDSIDTVFVDGVPVPRRSLTNAGHDPRFRSPSPTSATAVSATSAALSSSPQMP